MKLVVIENVKNPLKIGDGGGMVIWYNLFESNKSKKKEEKMSNPPSYTNTSPEANRIWHKRPLLLPLMFITGIALIMLGILNMDNLAQEGEDTSSGQTCQQYDVNSVTTCADAP
jgi:hypothetical protein